LYSQGSDDTNTAQETQQTNNAVNNPDGDSTATTKKVFNSSELAQATGKNGNPCYVVVDDTVYSISGFALWADGLHSPSGGRARCGKDLSSVIGQSPHGKSKLNLLQEVGVYQQ
jgi:predicted heme/steroid binding protein